MPDSRISHLWHCGAIIEAACCGGRRFGDELRVFDAVDRGLRQGRYRRGIRT
jgi:hypothetical protein